MGLRPWALGAAIGAFLVAVTLVLGYLRYTEARSHLDSGLGHLRSGVDVIRPNGGDANLETEQLMAARKELGLAEEEFVALRGAVSPFHRLLPAFGWLPRYGGELAAMPHLIEMAVLGARAAERGIAAAIPIAEVALQPKSASAMSEPEIASIVEALGSSKPQFAEAAQAVDGLAMLRRRIDLDSLREPRLLQAFEQLDRYLPTIQTALEAAAIAPEALGSETPKSYLLLLQNNAELRATGGFIGSAAIMTLDRGELAGLEFRDSYDFDSPRPRPSVSPPLPYAQYMMFQDWTLRDANWWADFPTSARRIEEFLALDQGMSVDGIIAIDQTVVQRILAVLGPVEVPRFEETVTADNLLELLDRYAHPPGYKAFDTFADERKLVLPDRKAFLGYLGEGIIERVEAGGAEVLLKILPVYRELLIEKHILMYFNDLEAASLARSADWDGALENEVSDFLMVVDTNVGYSKADPFIERSISYEIDIGPDLSPRSAQLSITYANTNDGESPHCQADVIDFWTSADSCYKDYVRAYIPMESRFIGASGLDSPPEVYIEGEKLVLAGLMVLKPGQQREVTFQYVPPRSAISYQSTPEYRLTVQKQPGTQAIPLSVRLELAEGVQARASQEGYWSGDRALVAQATLERDRHFAAPLVRK